jgi:N4-gp56 family major capsid protein
MATQVTTQVSLSPSMQTYYDKKLLNRLLANHVFGQFAQKRPIPKNGGKIINFRQFTSLAAATTPLTEGATPAGNSLNVTEKTATIAQYGDFIEVSDVLDMTAIDPVLDETAELLGEQSAETLDVLVRDVIAAGTSVQYANGRTARNEITTGDNLTVNEIRKAVRTMKRNKVKPIDGDYVLFVEPGTVYDLQSDAKWEEAAKYAGSKQIFTGEIGRLYGVRFIETPLAKVFPDSGADPDGTGALGPIDVYASIMVGKDAYGMVDVAGSGAVQNIVKPHGSAGTADPLNQRATSGWKALFTTVRLEELALLRIEHAVSA